MLSSLNTVAIPRRMAHLDKDPRGYPIPVMVLRDNKGKPHFTINPDSTRYLLLMDDQCSICGQPHEKRRWYVGGPLSAFDPNGTYYDPPLHWECMRYAMRVCPYLARSSYTGRIDAKTMTDDEPRRLFIDTAQDPSRPEVFVCVEANGQTIRDNPGIIGPVYVKPKRPYTRVQFWQNGQRLTDAEATQIVRGIIPDFDLSRFLRK